MGASGVLAYGTSKAKNTMEAKAMLRPHLRSCDRAGVVTKKGELPSAFRDTEAVASEVEGATGMAGFQHDE
jgi:hypothetical protein